MKVLRRNTNSYFQTYSHSINVASILNISPILFQQIFNAFKGIIISKHEERAISLVRVLVKATFSDSKGKLSYKTLGDLINFEVSDEGFTALGNILNHYLTEKSGVENYNSLTPVDLSFAYHLEHDPNVKFNKHTSVVKSGSNNKKALDRVIIKGRNVPISKKH